jgi:hypothetical protein
MFGLIVGGMKTKARAWRIYRARIWAGLSLCLILALAGFGNVFRFDRDCAWTIGQTQSVTQVYELADLFASR